jgi:hypothetical protein
LLEDREKKKELQIMNFNQLVVPAFALCLAVATPGSIKASALPMGQPVSGLAQEHGGWDMPPQELQETQRQGFHDGIEGARKDFDNHRRPNVNNRDEFRHPPVPRPEREAYREGFRRGYQVGVSHLMGDHDHDHDRDHDHY